MPPHELLLRSHFTVKIEVRSNDNRVRIRCQSGRLDKFSQRYRNEANATADIERWRFYLNVRRRGIQRGFVIHDPLDCTVAIEVEGSFTITIHLKHFIVLSCFLA